MEYIIRNGIIFVIALSLPILSGCSLVGTINFDQSKLSGVGNQQVDIVITKNCNKGSKKCKEDEKDTLKMAIKDKTVFKAITSVCKPKERGAVPLILIPAATTFGKWIFGQLIERRIKQIEALKKSAQKTYSSNVKLSAADFHNVNCITMVRYVGLESEKKLGFIAVLKIDDHKTDTAFSIYPAYVRAYNAVAVTKAVNSKEMKKFPKMDVSLGLSIKTMVTKKNSFPKVATVGGGVVSVSNIDIGPKARSIKCRSKCTSSDLIPYPNKKDPIISVSMSVTETGHVGIDFDQAKAELKAIEEALGPVLIGSLEKYLKER